MIGLTEGSVRKAGSIESPCASANALRALCLEAVYPYALRRLGAIEEAEDVTSEVFFAAWKGRKPRIPEPELRFWLIGVARRKVADVLRKRVKTQPRPNSEMGDLERVTVLSDLRDSVMRLPEPQREALLFFAVEGLSVPEIAKVMRKSISAVNALIRRARVALRSWDEEKEIPS